MSHSQSHVGPFRETLEAVREQIEIEAIPMEYRERAEEIALIVAEIYCLPEDMQAQIGGEKIPVGLIREIYSRLTADHVVAVLQRFETAAYEIKHVKTYMRTALYNAVFEAEGRTVNLVAQWEAR